MRYYIIIGITLILAIVIMFYNPYKDYLYIYDENMTIEYDNKEDGYEWYLIPSNDNLDVTEVDQNKWTVSISKKGLTKIQAQFVNLETNDVKYKINYEFKNNGKKIFWLSAVGHGLSDFPNPY